MNLFRRFIGLLTIMTLLAGVAPVPMFSITPTYAYTSAANPQDPATAPDNHVINFPDAVLKKELNRIISNIAPVSTRLPDQDITVKDAKRVSLMY